MSATRKSRTAPLAVEALGDRRVPAAALTASFEWANGSVGVLRVEGTEAADTITIRQVNGVLTVVGVGSVPAAYVGVISVRGLGGNDTIRLNSEATAGQQPITAGAVIDAGAGNDLVLGASGMNIILAGAGDDVVAGGTGDDTIFGGPGNDWAHGSLGNDILVGGDFGAADTGNDTLYGGGGHDLMFGHGGADYLSGGDGVDILHGGDGADTLLGDAGDDYLFFDLADYLYGTVNGGTGATTFAYDGTEAQLNTAVAFQNVYRSLDLSTGAFNANEIPGYTTLGQSQSFMNALGYGAGNNSWFNAAENTARNISTNFAMAQMAQMGIYL